MKEPPQKPRTGKEPEAEALKDWRWLEKQFAAEGVAVIFSQGEGKYGDGRIGEYRWDSNPSAKGYTTDHGAIVFYVPALEKVANEYASMEAKWAQDLAKQTVADYGPFATNMLNYLAEKGMLKHKSAFAYKEEFYDSVLKHELAHHRQRYELETSPEGEAAKEVDKNPAGLEDPWHGPQFQKHMRAVAPSQATPFFPEHYGIKTPGPRRAPSEYEDFEGGSPVDRGRFGPQAAQPPVAPPEEARTAAMTARLPASAPSPRPARPPTSTPARPPRPSTPGFALPPLGGQSKPLAS